MFKQLTASDRAVLAQLIALKVPKKEIAHRLHKHRSTVYRELARNTGPLGYVPEEAQQRTDVRRWAMRQRRSAIRTRFSTSVNGSSVTGRRIRLLVAPSWTFASRIATFLGRRFMIGSVNNQPRSVGNGVTASVLVRRGGNVEKMRADCLAPCASRDDRRALPRGVGTAIGRETRSSGVAIGAACYRLWSARVASRCWPTSWTAGRRVCVRRRSNVWPGCPRRCVGQQRLTTARNSPNMNNSAWRRAWPSPSPDRTLPGNVERTNTPTVWCGNTCRKGPILWRSAAARWPPLNLHSTIVRESDSATALPARFLISTPGAAVSRLKFEPAFRAAYLPAVSRPAGPAARTCRSPCRLPGSTPKACSPGRRPESFCRRA